MVVYNGRIGICFKFSTYKNVKCSNWKAYSEQVNESMGINTDYSALYLGMRIIYKINGGF